MKDKFPQTLQTTTVGVGGVALVMAAILWALVGPVAEPELAKVVGEDVAAETGIIALAGTLLVVVRWTWHQLTGTTEDAS